MKHLICWLFFLGVMYSSAAGQSAYEPAPVDVETADGIVAALYDVISGPAGASRNWDRMRSLFKPEARLTAVGRDREGKFRYTSMTVDDYIERNGPFLEKNGFFEVELSRKTDTYGLVSQLFSTYASRRTAEGEIFARGINSIQLIYDGQRYWILNVLWNSETPDNPIPEKYLGN